MRVLVIDNYDSFTYNLVHFLGELGADIEVVRNDKITLDAIAENAPDALVISPGPCTPTEAGISVPLIERFADKIPIFGVCLGMQSIGQAFGGDVVGAPQLMHGKVSTIHAQESALFKNVPADFEATRYHSLVVAPDTLPADLKVTATADNGVIMAVEHKSLPVYGVQFHPESIASEHGRVVLQNFLDAAQAFNRDRIA